MIIPVIFAALVWGIAMRWRRQWPAAVAIGGAALVLFFVWTILSRLEDAATLLFWPYGFTVLGMGGFIAVLPRRPARHECTKCFYDLRGLDPEGLLCPECGQPWCGRGSGREPPDDVLIPMRSGPRKRTNVI
jgi:hypothetical protein